MRSKKAGKGAGLGSFPRGRWQATPGGQERTHGQAPEPKTDQSMIDAGDIQARARWAIEKRPARSRRNSTRTTRHPFRSCRTREKKEIDRDEEEKRRKNSKRNILREQKISNTLGNREKKKWSPIGGCLGHDTCRRRRSWGGG